ncbi:MAG: TauD/TfdA family dioxygenase [Oceanospirillaceae bacterium]|nr:TauD/TfdA family dioxygenase [Oceanospirillaceae bacterium]
MSDYLVYKNRRYHYFWLRDNCQCEHCRHASGQRIHETSQLNSTVRVARSHETPTGLEIVWSGDDQHRSFFSSQFLAQHCYDEESTAVIKKGDKQQLWGAALTDNIPCFDYLKVSTDDDEKCQWLNSVVTHGLAKLINVPTEPGTILKVVAQFGYVRSTNYGDLFEVLSVEKAVNLAYTPIPLSLHTDNPYRNPVPTLQLLHCLVKADRGGVTALADGFYAAEILRAEYPEEFTLLTRQKVAFKFASADAILQHKGCMIEIDPSGAVAAIRINNRSVAPFDLPFSKMLPYYRAYRQFMRILQGDACKVTLTLAAGELILFDNQRVLHGREVQAIGARHLQGCYADRDGLQSTAALLNATG